MISALLLLLQTASFAAPGDFELLERLMGNPGWCHTLADDTFQCGGQLSMKSSSVTGEDASRTTFEFLEARGLGAWNGPTPVFAGVAVVLSRTGRQIGRHVDYHRAGRPAYERESLVIQLSRDGGVLATRIKGETAEISAACEMKDVIVVPAADGGEDSRCLRTAPAPVSPDDPEVLETLREARAAARARL